MLASKENYEYCLVITPQQPCCGRVKFSGVCVCLFTGGSYTSTSPAPPHCPYPGQGPGPTRPRHVQICSTWTSLYRLPPHVMFKRVHLESYYARRKPKHPHHPRRYSQSCSLCSTDYRQAGGSYLTEIPSCCLSFNIL